MIKSFVFLLDIPVMINILYEMIKILHVKMQYMQYAIYLYWFHNDTLAENNSLNGHSNEPWINRLTYLLSSKIFLAKRNFPEFALNYVCVNFVCIKSCTTLILFNKVGLFGKDSILEQTNKE